VATGIVIDATSESQTAFERPPLDWSGGDPDCLESRCRKNNDIGCGLEIPLINRHESHPADGAIARLVGPDPGMHRALIKLRLVLGFDRLCTAKKHGRDKAKSSNPQKRIE
jgi:hypothetical protein